MKSYIAKSGHWFSAGKKFILAHKVLTGAALAVLLLSGSYTYGKLTSTAGETRYVLGNVATGTIVASVSASGQVSTSRTVEIKPEVSGKITYVGVKAGQKVAVGTLIAQIDTIDAQKALRDAKNNLETAKLNLEKTQKPASGLTLLQAQNAVTSAQDSLAKTYTDSGTDVVNAYLALPAIMTGLEDILTDTTASRGSQWNIDYYKNATINYDNNASSYRDNAYNAYTKAKTTYNKAFADYNNLPNSPTTDQTETITNETYLALQDISIALKSTNSFIQFYKDTVAAHNQQPASVAETALTNLNTYIGTVAEHLSGLSSDTAAIKSGKQSIVEKQASLQDITDGPDELDVRSDQLTIQQREDAVLDAQNELAKYYVRAPFAGTIASVDAYVGDTGGSATVATIITNDQIAELSLNEVDAAKVKVGGKATLTFDAIDDLTLTGVVAEVSPVGAVSQGVVSYTVKINFDAQDQRIKSGMTVNAAIQTATKQNTLIVPSSAVKTTNGQSYILVFTPPIEQTGVATEGILSSTPPTQVPVEVGISDDTNVEILSGVTAGEQIVVRSITASTKPTTTTAASPRTGGGGAIRF